MTDRVRLLDIDPDLGAELTAEELDEVNRYVVLPAVTVGRGPFGLDDVKAVAGLDDVLGFVVCSGIASMEVWLAGRGCTRMLMPTEIVLLDDAYQDTLAPRWGWSAFEPTTLALLDERLLVFGRRWPKLMKAILRCAAHQSRHALLQQAVSQLPRIQDRLLGLMWSIAARHGVVREDGIWIRMPVTHDVLARMVGARRPTVTLGLKGLTQRGLITPSSEGWTLAHDSYRAFPGARR